MAARKQPGKRYFTVSEANATLPYVRAVVRDVTELAAQLRERPDLERGPERMQEYEEELRKIGVELKDYFKGLIDFPSVMDGREVYLCWRLGEPEVGHWHELEAGFAGRRKLMAGPVAR